MLAPKIAAHIAKKVSQDPDTFKKVIRMMAIISIGCCFLILLIPIMALSLPGLIAKELLHDESTDFTLQKSKTFQKVEAIYDEYINDLDIEIKKRIVNLRESSKRTIYTKDEETGAVIVSYEYPQINSDINTEKPEYELVLAYIATKYQEFQDVGEIEEFNYKFNKQEIKKFLNDITTIKEYKQGSDPIYFSVYTAVLPETEIAEKYFKEREYEDYKDKREQYLFSYESFGGTVIEVTEENTENGDVDVNLDETTQYENGMKIPHYLQYDTKWGKIAYGTGTISSSGCGPTSFAMVASYFNQVVISPDMTAAWSLANGFRIPNQGTSWSFFSAAASHWGMQCQNLGLSSESVVAALKNGKPVISSMKPGTFTKTGHFIVLRGVTADNKILVNDPNDNFHTKNYYKRAFDLSLIMREGKNFWSFSE